MTLPRLLTAQEACEYLAISRTTLWRLVRDHKLKPFGQRESIRQRLRFSEAAILEYLGETDEREATT